MEPTGFRIYILRSTVTEYVRNYDSLRSVLDQVLKPGIFKIEDARSLQSIDDNVKDGLKHRLP